MGLNPAARLYVQSKDLDFGATDAEAIIFESPSTAQPNNPFMEVTVEAAVSAEGTVIRAEIRLSGVLYSDIVSITDQGFLKIEAGYPNDGTAPMQTVFFGKFKGTDYDVDGGKRVWMLYADPFPLDLARTPVSFNEKNILIGDAIKKVYAKLGVTGEITPLAFGQMGTLGLKTVEVNNAVATITDWSVNGQPAFKVLHDLVMALRANIKETYGVDRRIGLIPDTTIGFAYNIIDFDTSEPFQVLDYDVDTPLVMSGGTIPQEDIPADPAVDTASEGVEESQSEETVVTPKKRQYKLVIVFDPRITLATVVNVKDKQLGSDTPVQVTSYKHVMTGKPGGWRTELVGEILGGLFAE